MQTKAETVNRRITLNTRRDMAQRIDETKLTFAAGENPEAVIEGICENAVIEGFRAVCVRPQHVRLAKSILKGHPVLVATVIAFPQTKAALEDQRRDSTFGDISWEQKAEEMQQSKVDGADEFDIVMNTHFFKALDIRPTNQPETYELIQLVENAFSTPIKLIIETDLMSDEEIIKATSMCIGAGIDYVKTSTGMLDGGQGATVHDVSLIYREIQESPISKKPGIKASGGIRTAKQAFELLQAGADIVGSSSGTLLLNDFDAKNRIEFNL
jgi:deoxyribose-phosphate aldolase